MSLPQKENGYTQIANEIIEALASTRINGEAMQVLLVIFRKTYGFKKKEDTIFLAQFEKMTGIPKSKVCRALRKLREMKVITQKGKGRNVSYSFNKDYKSWILFPKKGKNDLFPKKGTFIPQKGKTLFPKKGKRINTKENHTKETTKETILRKDTMHPMQKMFYDTHNKRFTNKYVANFGKDGKIFKDLEKIITNDEMSILIKKFFECTDDFVLKAGYTVGVFKSQINKLRNGSAKKVKASTSRTMQNAKDWIDGK